MPDNPSPSATPSPVVFITGAARGIGLATARRFLAEGWRLARLDKDRTGLENSRAELMDITPPSSVLDLVADLALPQQVTQSFEQMVQHFGRLDALVNNAGEAIFKPVLDTAYDEWSRIMAVNLSGPFLCTNLAAPVMMKNGGGSVVNIGSISGLRASTLRVAYGTSKAALAHLTRQQAAELAEGGIRVNLVAPGPVETAMAAQVHTPEIRRDYRNAIPLGRYGTEEELANAIFFLCSPQASYITGQVLAVDGGFDAVGIGLSTLRGE